MRLHSGEEAKNGVREGERVASLETVMPLTVCHSIATLWSVKCLNVDRFVVLLTDEISCSFGQVDRFTVLLTYETSCSFDLGKHCVFKHRFRASNTNFNYNCIENICCRNDYYFYAIFEQTYLIKRTTNSPGIHLNRVVCCTKVPNLHIFPPLNINCTEPFLSGT